MEGDGSRFLFELVLRGKLPYVEGRYPLCLLFPGLCVAWHGMAWRGVAWRGVALAWWGVVGVVGAGRAWRLSGAA